MAAHGSPDRQDRDDQHRDADATKPEAERRPDEQGNRRIQESGRRVGTRGRLIEYEDAQRHRTRPDERRFQHTARGRGSRASDEQMVRTQQKRRHQDDGRDGIRDAQVAPFDPIVRAETVGDRKRSTPEGGPERNEHHGDQDEENRVTKRDRLDGRLDQKANRRRCRDALHSVERLGGQCVQRRPVRLLGSQEMSADGREQVGPPVPGGDEQQDGEQNRVRGEEEGDFAVGEAKRPGHLRGDVVADGARQDAPQRAERCPGGASLWSGVHPSRELITSAQGSSARPGPTDWAVYNAGGHAVVDVASADNPDDSGCRHP